MDDVYAVPADQAPYPPRQVWAAARALASAIDLIDLDRAEDEIRVAYYGNAEDALIAARDAAPPVLQEETGTRELDIRFELRRIGVIAERAAERIQRLAFEAAASLPSGDGERELTDGEIETLLDALDGHVSEAHRTEVESVRGKLQGALRDAVSAYRFVLVPTAGSGFVEALEACEQALLTGIDWCRGPSDGEFAARVKMHTARGKALEALAAVPPSGETGGGWAHADQRRAYEAGRSARLNSMTRDCPFPSQQDLEDAWNEGWDRADAELAEALAAPPAGETGEGRGVELIAAERRRQVEQEGWTPEHDDKHGATQGLAQAAACYASEAWMPLTDSHRRPPVDWPWKGAEWKPTGDPISDLTKAGALIAAEIDRLERVREVPSEGGRNDG